MPEAARTQAQSEPPMRELALGLSYPQSLERAGAMPVILPPLLPEVIDLLVARLDGLLLTGGPDLHPGTYGKTPHPALGPTEREIDAFELALIRAAERRGLPVLAICRGMQALNVALGGTLVQDLPSERPGGLTHRQEEAGRVPTHPVRLAEGSRIARIAGTTEIEVNSFHHQAIDRLGAGLRPAGWAPDGVIEAVEDPTARFVVGVQWHAESLSESQPVQADLLAAFVGEAADWRGVEAVA
jgi:putative glutamine amidotransferase